MAMHLKVKTAYDSSSYIITLAPAYILVDVPGDGSITDAECKMPYSLTQCGVSDWAGNEFALYDKDLARLRSAYISH